MLQARNQPGRQFIRFWSKQPLAVRLRGHAHPATERPYGLHDVRHRRPRIDEHVHPCLPELLAQFHLAFEHDHQVRPQCDDAFHVGIEQRAHSGQALDVGRVVIEAADRDHPRSRADREEHLGGGGHQRDDARGGRGRARAIVHRRSTRRQAGDCEGEAGDPPSPAVQASGELRRGRHADLENPVAEVRLHLVLADVLPGTGISTGQLAKLCKIPYRGAPGPKRRCESGTGRYQRRNSAHKS